MLSRIAVATLVASIVITPAAYAGKKPAHHSTGKKHAYSTAHGKTCKKEFMYMKGKKCVDARKTTA